MPHVWKGEATSAFGILHTNRAKNKELEVQRICSYAWGTSPGAFEGYNDICVYVCARVHSNGNSMPEEKLYVASLDLVLMSSYYI